MKEKTLVIEEYGPTNREKTEYFLDQLLLTEELYLTIRWKFYHRKIEKKLLEHLAEMIRKRGIHKEFVVNMVIETDQWRAIKTYRKTFNQYGFVVELAASPSLKPQTVRRLGRKMLLESLLLKDSDYQTLRKTYDIYKHSGIPVVVSSCTLSNEEYTDWFDTWVNEPDSCWIDLFQDMTGYLLTGFHMSDCTHNSCLGKYLYVNAKGETFFCRKKEQGSRIQNIEDGRIHDAAYEETLKKAVEKRNLCKKDCQWFVCCQGGCPLQAYQGCSDQDYLKKIQYVREYINKHSKNYFSDVPNPALRQMFLSTAAFGFRM